MSPDPRHPAHRGLRHGGKNIEPSIKAISTSILLVTAVLIYVADRLGRDTSLTVKG